MFLGHFLSGQDGVDVDSNGVFHPSRIPAGKCGHHGNPAPARFLENLPIALFQTFFRQRQSSKLIFAVGVGAANVKNNIRPKSSSACRTAGISTPKYSSLSARSAMLR